MCSDIVLNGDSRSVDAGVVFPFGGRPWKRVVAAFSHASGNLKCQIKASDNSAIAGQLCQEDIREQKKTFRLDCFSRDTVFTASRYPLFRVADLDASISANRNAASANCFSGHSSCLANQPAQLSRVRSLHVFTGDVCRSKNNRVIEEPGGLTLRPVSQP